MLPNYPSTQNLNSNSKARAGFFLAYFIATPNNILDFLCEVGEKIESVKLSKAHWSWVISLTHLHDFNFEVSHIYINKPPTQISCLSFRLSKIYFITTLCQTPW